MKKVERCALFGSVLIPPLFSLSLIVLCLFALCVRSRVRHRFSHQMQRLRSHAPGYSAFVFLCIFFLALTLHSTTLHVTGGDAMQTFTHFVSADILLQSISMFSNTAAIVSRNLKVFSQWNRSLRSFPNTVAATPNPSDPSQPGLPPDQMQRFRLLWRAYAACNGKRWRRKPDEAATPSPTSSSAATSAAPSATPTPTPAPPAPAPPPPPPSPKQSTLSAEEEYERHLAAHDEF
jgi:hypothetical protein